jgi:hypothetical protein
MDTTPEKYFDGRRAMAPTDPRPGSALTMVDARLAYDTPAYHLEEVFV